ncbi:MAG: CHAT domain-containing protein, partial [Bacteroidota bacterium]
VKMNNSYLISCLLLLIAAAGCNLDANTKEVTLIEEVVPISERLSQLDQAVYSALEQQEIEAAKRLLRELTQAVQQAEYVALGGHLAYYEAYFLNREVRFDESLQKARLAWYLLNQKGQYVTRDIKIACTHLLTELHFEYSAHLDSVRYFSALGNELLARNGSTTLQAQQKLSNTYRHYYDRAWTDMIADAENASRMLLSQDSSFQASNLMGKLLLMGAIGCKKVGSFSTAEADQERLYAKSDSLAYLAEGIFLANNSPLWRKAREYILDLSIRRDDEIIFREKLSLLNQRPEQRVDYYGDIDRLLGYYYFNERNYDKAKHHLTQHLSKGPYFSRKALDEASYYLLQIAYDEHDYPFAESLLFQVFREEMCCDQCEHQEDLLSLSPNEMRDVGDCSFFITAFADLYLRRYDFTGEEEDLLVSRRLSQVALNSFETVIGSQEEDIILNKMAGNGHRILDAAFLADFTYAYNYPTDASIERVIRTMETGKSYLLNQALNDFGSSRAIADSLQRLQAEISLYKYQITYEANIPSQLMDELSRLNQRYAELAKKGREYISAYDQTAKRPTVSLTELKEELGTEQAFLSFLDVAGKLYAVYIDRDTNLLYQPQVPANLNLASQTQAYRRLLSANDLDSLQRDSLQTLSLGLYNLLVQPVRTTLAKRNELIISPSAQLRNVAFAALLQNVENRADQVPDYLINDYIIRYVPSWKVEQLNALKRAEIGQQSRIGIWTNPDLKFYLAGVADQLEASSSSRKTYHYRAQECSSDRFLEEYKGYDILHLSVHAMGNPERLNDNYLIFAPGDSLNGVKISAGEIAAKLVVLAACSTGQGKQGGHEGIFSIQRSFHLAGVPDVLASLWDIPAASTNDVLLAFYRQLFQGQSPAVALALAQRACLAGELNSRRTSPRHWAGLVIG